MDKTNLNPNWQRLESVIRWSNMTINSFAKYIGLSRAENLYQIKNGNNGISHKLARRIVEFFPAISIGWLLTGEGTMLPEEYEVGTMPYYRGLDSFLAYCRGTQSAPDGVVCFPLAADAELAFVVSDGYDNPESCVSAECKSAKKSVFLKKIAVEEIIPSSYYMILTSNFVYLRKVTTTQSGDECCISLADDGWGFVKCLEDAEHNVPMLPDAIIPLSQIEVAYRVVGVYEAI